MSAIALTIAASFIAPQTMLAKNGDPLMRPIVPDARLLLVQWVQDDLRLSKEEIRLVQGELAPSFDSMRRIPRPAIVATKRIMADHEKRLYELSLRSGDLFCLTVDSVAREVGLSETSKKRIEALFRGYFESYSKAEDTDLKVRMSGAVPNPKAADPMLFRAKVAQVRKAVRAVLKPRESERFERMKGAPPAVPQIFGWHTSAPTVLVPDGNHLLAFSAVQADLKLTERQMSAVKDSFGDFRSDPENWDPSHWKSLAVLDDEQTARFRQLVLQFQGPAAVFRSDIGAQLGMTDDQRDPMLLVMQGFWQKDLEYQELGRKPHVEGQADIIDGAIGRPLRQKLWKERDAWILSSLTSSQRAKYHALLGKLLPEIKPLTP